MVSQRSTADASALANAQQQATADTIAAILAQGDALKGELNGRIAGGSQGYYEGGSPGYWVDNSGAVNSQYNGIRDDTNNVYGQAIAAILAQNPAIQAAGSLRDATIRDTTAVMNDQQKQVLRDFVAKICDAEDSEPLDVWTKVLARAGASRVKYIPKEKYVELEEYLKEHPQSAEDSAASAQDILAKRGDRTESERQRNRVYLDRQEAQRRLAESERRIDILRAPTTEEAARRSDLDRQRAAEQVFSALPPNQRVAQEAQGLVGQVAVRVPAPQHHSVVVRQRLLL